MSSARARQAVGRNVLRKEGAAKVSGAARYIDDLSFPNLLYGRTVRSTIPCGEIANGAVQTNRYFRSAGGPFS